jgi:hypothetical protein
MNCDITPFAKYICAKLELWRSLTSERGVSDEAIQEERERKLDQILLPGLRTKLIAEMSKRRKVWLKAS